ncbi:translocation/assembly module TamB domain-containing protein, partial [Halorhodospira neutriphila]
AAPARRAAELAASLEGERLELGQLPRARLRVSPDLTVRAEPGTVRVDGRVAIPAGRIEIQEVPEKAVSRSKDVVIVGEAAGEEAGAEAGEPVPEGWRVRADVEIGLGDELALFAFGVEGKLGGALRVLYSEESGPEAFGELRIDEGRYRAYGQRLRIRRGLLLFTGPVNRPQLDIEAVRRIERDEVTAGVRVEGYADAPEVSLFSEPAMAETDALSYLIRGRPMGAEGPGEDAMLAQAALALGVYGGGKIASSVAEQLGVEDFEIETRGQGEGAEVVVSGYVRPRLYVAYGVGVFTPSNTVTLRYFLTWQLYLEAVSGEDSALDLMYRFEID